MAKKLSNYERNLQAAIADRLAREQGNPIAATPVATGQQQVSQTKTRPILTPNAVAGLILVAGAAWLYWHFQTPSPSAARMPPDERAFVAAIEQARTAWKDAPNVLAQGPMPAARNTAICQTLKSLNVTGWAGTLSSVDASATTDSNGKKIASIGITIARGITIATPPVIALFADPSRDIEEGSPLYQTVAALPLNSGVTFGGSFTPGGTTCIRELSLTNNGAMTTPVFSMALRALEAAH